MTSLTKIFASSLACILLTSCDSGSEWRSGDYEVYWIDIQEERRLGLNVGGGGYIGRVPHQIFAVGDDDDWVVAGRHTSRDKLVKQFYYLSKHDDGPDKNAKEVVHGPFTRIEFDLLKRDLNLPNFSKFF